MSEKSITEIREREFRFEKIQEAYQFIEGKIKDDEVQEACIEYLAEFRDLDKQVLRETGVFFAEDQKELELLTSFDEEFQYYLGFLRKNLNYNNRYVFPVKNYQNHLWGWNGYDWESSAKYLIGMLGLGDKKDLMYGLDKMDKMFEEDTVIVHEGLFDTLRMRELGYPYAVSLLGKRMSDWQIRVLNRFKKKILIPDGDEAGEKAAMKWTSQLSGHVGLVRIKEEEREFTNPEGETYTKVAKDTDDKVRGSEEKKEAFKEMIEKMKSSLEEQTYVEVEF